MNDNSVFDLAEYLRNLKYYAITDKPSRIAIVVDQYNVHISEIKMDLGESWDDFTQRVDDHITLLNTSLPNRKSP